MNPTLKAMLAALGVVVVGGVTVSLWTPEQGVTAQQLIDGADGGCSRRDVRIVLRGEHCDGGGYCRKRIDVARCPEGDGGFSVIIPRKYRDLLPTAEFISAPSASTLGPDGEAADTFDCACATDAGTCLLSDGGPAPMGTTLQPGWTGACVRKACVEVAGFNSMPAECL